MQDDIDRLVEEKKEQRILKCVRHVNKKLHSAKLAKYNVHFYDKVSSTIDPYDYLNVKPLENKIDIVVG